MHSEGAPNCKTGVLSFKWGKAACVRTTKKIYKQNREIYICQIPFLISLGAPNLQLLTPLTRLPANESRSKMLTQMLVLRRNLKVEPGNIFLVREQIRRRHPVKSQKDTTNHIHIENLTPYALCSAGTPSERRGPRGS